MPNGKATFGKPKAPTLAPAQSDANRKKLGIVNPFSRTWGPSRIATGVASSGIKRT
jgi:hypothetical protein